MATWQKVVDAIKGVDPKLFKEVYFQDIHDFVVEERVTSKGRYVMKLSFKADELLKNPDGGIPRRRSDMKLVPYLVFIEQNFGKGGKNGQK